jgi:hypothetical protein
MSKIKTVNSGVDSLWLNFCYQGTEGPDKRPCEPGILEVLLPYQEEAKVQDEPVETQWSFNHHPLLMYPHGGGARSPWRYLLRNDDMELKIGTGKKTGFVAKVRLMASYLWPMQYGEGTSLVDAIAEAWVCVCEIFGRELYAQVSEVHLCADVAGYDFSRANWQDGFIRRCGLVPHFDHEMHFVETESEEDAAYLVGPDKVHMRYRSITGYSFGTHASAISAVVYDKWRYIRLKERASDYFYLVWGRNGWDGVAPVWRVEFRLKRDILRDFKIEDICHGIDDAFDLPDYLEVIWQYCSIHWVRYVVPSEDTNRTRWETHEAWQVVQSAFFPLVNIELAPIVRERKRVVKEEQLIAQIVGCMMTRHAWKKGKQLCTDDDLSLVLHYLYEEGLAYLQRSRKDFCTVVQKKQCQYHLLEKVAA